MELSSERFEGPELVKRLEQCASEANVNHLAVDKYARRALQHAYEAGKALLEAKRLNGRGKWGPWRQKHFHASAETARVYMRVAANWEHPDIVEARVTIDVGSIAEFLSILRGERKKIAEVAPDKVSKMFRAEWLCGEIAAACRNALKLMDVDEVDYLYEHFPIEWCSLL